MASNLLLLSLGCFVLTYSLAHLYRVAALALQIVDEPNQRSAHTLAVPSGAGVSFVLVTMLGCWLAATQEPGLGRSQLIPLLPAIFIATLGFVDDVRNLSWRVRLAGQMVAAGAVMTVLSFPALHIGTMTVHLGWFGQFLGFSGLVLLLNFYNFMDGIDGIATSEALFVLGAVLFLGTAVDGAAAPVLILLASLLGFLLINWNPAKVFMGDAGSACLGFVLGVFILQEVLVPVWTWLILLGFFIGDAGLTIVHRLIRGERIQEAHSQHAYQHLHRRYGPIRTLYVVHGINVCWLLPLAWLSARYPVYGLPLLVLALAGVMILQFRWGAGKPVRGMET